MRLVLDASIAVQAVLDPGPGGTWASDLLAGSDLVAPHLIHAEVAQALRRTAARGLIEDVAATIAHEALVHLPIDLWSYEPAAERAWELRQNVTAYDAWYVALAELLEVPLVTADRALARAPGLRCEVLVPPTA